MNTCGDCRRWPADGRHSSQALERAFAKQALERAFAGQAFDEDACADPLRWKAPRALECRRIDVLRQERAHATGPLARESASRTAAHERCQRVRLGGALASRQSGGASLPPGAQSALERGSRSARSRRRVVKRAAVGGPDDRKVVRRRPRKARTPKSVRGPTGDLEIERWRVSHGARWAVSKGDVCHGCSWRETSVVEASSRHLGAVSEG